MRRVMSSASGRTTISRWYVFYDECLSSSARWFSMPDGRQKVILWLRLNGGKILGRCWDTAGTRSKTRSSTSFQLCLSNGHDLDTLG